MEKQKRFLTNEVTVRELTEENNDMIIEGRAITYDVRSSGKIYNKFYEVINKESVDEFLQNNDLTVRANLDHDDNAFLGKSGKNLQLDNREDGLYYRLSLPNTTLGRDTYELAQRGLIDSNSFEFIPKEEEVRFNSGDEYRFVKRMHLHAISLLTKTPAYKESYAEARSLPETWDEQKETNEVSKEVEERDLTEYYQELKNKFNID